MLSRFVCFSEFQGVFVSTGIGNINEIDDSSNLLNAGKRYFQIVVFFLRLSPFYVPRILNNLPASNISIRFGFQGPCVSNNMACASSAYSILEGLKFPRFHYLTMQFDPSERIGFGFSRRDGELHGSLVLSGIRRNAFAVHPL